MKVNVYLLFDGNCEEAFNFYKAAFGKEFEMINRFKEMPPVNGQPAMPAEDAEKIMHVSLPIDGDSVLMGSDSGADMSEHYKAGNNFSVSISTETRSEADRLFAAISDDGEITMAMEDTFWGEYFGMFTDKFGISWMIGSREQPAS
ncbi:VOC family protein [Maribellus mangrovi]|uniref:VOC family protein n=1 Tax=Maribellus mangrovi TaxID=3133146 RepID=UPI0030ED96CD